MTPRCDLPTDRLCLRRWLPSDRAPFAALNADPRVMEYFPATMSQDESDALVDRIEDEERIPSDAPDWYFEAELQRSGLWEMMERCYPTPVAQSQ